ncbi:putative triacylglycerol lipase [Helianthus debilis subsp. tardiflorus]
MEGSFSLCTLVILASMVVAFVNVPLAFEAQAFFVFGDSLVDNGNNDFLVTTARANSPPYGIDFPTHRPTGRFSNGLNIPDLISCAFIIKNLYHINVSMLYSFTDDIGTYWLHFLLVSISIRFNFCF